MAGCLGLNPDNPEEEAKVKGRTDLGSYRLNLADLFDRLGRLKPFKDLPPEVAQEIASFDVVRITRTTGGATVVTEELIRVKTRDRRAASIARRGGTSITPREVRSQPITRALVTSHKALAGSGRTAAAEARHGQG